MNQINLKNESTKKDFELNDTKIDNKFIQNETELYNEISTAFDSTLECLNKVSNKIEQENNIKQDVEAEQSNKMKGVKIIGVSGSKVNIDQSNKIDQNVMLSAIVQSLNEMKVSDQQKAIISDMLNLTQKSSADQSAKAATGMSTDAQTKSITEKKQTFINSVVSGGRGLISFETFSDNRYIEHFPCVVNCINGSNSTTEVTDIKNFHNEANLTDIKKNKQTDIQNYMTTLKNKNENISEFSNNLRNNLAQGIKAKQTNELEDLQIGNITDGAEVNLSQENEMVQKIVTSFETFVQNAAAVLNENTNETQKGTTTDQGSDSKQASEAQAEMKSVAVTDESTKITQDNSSSMSFIVMIVALVIVAAIAVPIVKSLLGGSGVSGFSAPDPSLFYK